MNPNRARRYLALIQRGALKAQRRILDIDVRKRRLVDSLRYGTPAKGYSSRYRWLLRESPRQKELQNRRDAIMALKYHLIPEEQLALVNRVERGIRNFRKAINLNDFVKSARELRIDPNYFVNIVNRISELETLIGIYKQRINAGYEILLRVDDSSLLEFEYFKGFNYSSFSSFNRVLKDFLGAYDNECEANRNIFTKMAYVRETFPEFIVEIKREYERLSKIEKNEEVVEKIGRMTCNIFIVGIIIFGVSLFGQTFLGSRPKADYSGWLIGSLIGFFGMSIIEGLSREIAAFLYDLRS